MPAEEASAAIVLRARDYSESDRIVTLLTRDFGKLGGIAKGAKASRRRFERKLEPFSHAMLYFRRRPHGQLVFITRAEASAELRPFNIDDDLGKIALGSYMLELTEALTSEGAEAGGAYRVLEEALWTVSERGAGLALRQGFELKFLRWAGFGLEFARCRQCAAATAEDAPAYFIVSRGGIVCARCRPGVPEGALRLEGQSAVSLARLAELSLADAHDTRPAGADAALAISRFLSSVLDRRLRSAAFVDSVLPGGSRA
jgi:DNA repair protein RecO (recombination protein O)